MFTTTDDDRPEFLTAEQIAADLSLSNEEGHSWFGYSYENEQFTAVLYNDEGQIIKRFNVNVDIEELPL